MWIKILCIEYILGIPTIESTFDVANMVKTATVKDLPIDNDALLNIQACKGRLPVVPVVRDFCYAIQPEWIFLRLVVPVARPSKTTTLGYRAAHGVQLLNFARL